MAATVYLLCAGTSMLCAALLLRAYARTGTRLLFWSGLCFVGLAVNNTILVIDRLVVTDVDLSTWRPLPAVAGLGLLLYGLIWESE